MSNRYKLDNGWWVERDKNGTTLYVTPIVNSVFRKHQEIKIPEEVFEAIVQGECSVQNLFKKFKLHSMIISDAAVEINSKAKLVNTPTKYFGRGFIVTKEGTKHFLTYQLASQGSGSRKFEISAEIYKTARTGKYSNSDLFEMYNLYHLDVPAHDVK